MNGGQAAGSLEYEPQVGHVRPDVASVQATMAAGCFAAASWACLVGWYGMLWGVGRGGFWYISVPCALWLVGGACEVAAILERPTWWATKVVGWVLVVEGLVIGWVMAYAFIQLVAELWWFVFVFF